VTACACYGGRLCRLTFELSGRQRQDDRARPVRMLRVQQAGRWRPAVGAPLERGVRRHSDYGLAGRVDHVRDAVLLEKV
jgi:hypothetical protein